jgi:anaerobic nitric oxide reductase transcription regulator
VLTRLLHEMKLVATSDLPVLLLGETGVGKELFARLLHRHSARRGKPLVHVNCAALPESLAESELFGHRRGAFSGAVTDRPGRFEAAEGGTLFLDEVGELPLPVQAKLLRTLQNGEIQRLGADEPRRVNVRVVAATNRNLRDLVAAGSFAPTCTTACRSTRCRFHRCASAKATCCCWPGAFWSSTAPAWAAQPAAVRCGPGGAAQLPLAGQHARAGACDQPRRPQGPEPGRQPPCHRDAGARGARPRRPARRGHAAHCCGALVAHRIARSGPCGPPLREAIDTCQRQSIQSALEQHRGHWANAARQLGLDASNLHKLARRLGLK